MNLRDSLLLGLVAVVLLFAAGRTFTGAPAIRASAASLAELLKRDPSISARARPDGPPPATWSDRALAQTPLWRTFSTTLAERLGAGAELAVRGHADGVIVWARLPETSQWIHWQTRFKATGQRAGVLMLAVAMLIGGLLLARQLERRSSRAAEQEREAILAGVSHDMRTPITRARFALELYGEDAAPRLVAEVERNLHELEEATDRFVAYTRSHYDEPFRATSFDDLVRSVLEMRGLTGEVEFVAGAAGLASLQPRNVQALIDNVIGNALKHGRAPIRIRTRQAGPDVIFSVKDGGAGIHPSHHVEVLQPFTRLSESTAPGSGLGLAIVTRVAQSHGGHVELRNLDDGFEVRVTLRAPSRR